MLAKPSGIVPLLEKTGLSVHLQAARFEHPTLPKIRLQSQLPRLKLFFSPARLRRLMKIINAAIPGVTPKFYCNLGHRSRIAKVLCQK